MTFNKVIAEIMPLVNDGDTSTPFVISRQNGEWVVNYPYPAEKTQEFLDGVKQADPLAVSLTGAYFSRGSAAHVYDKLLAARVYAEYNHETRSGAITGATYKEPHALVSFFEDNVGAFSHKATDYLTTFDRPLSALREMCPFSMTTDYEGWSYDEESAQEAIDFIENEVNDRLHSYPEEDTPERRGINGYEERSSLQIAGRIVILAENANEVEPYMVATCRWDNPLNIKEYYDAVVTADYFEAVGEFIKRQSMFLEQLENERTESGLPFHTLTAADCLPHAMEGNITGKVIVIKPESLTPEYRTADHQIKLCTGGNGTRPEARGSAVFCTDLYSGESSRFERWDVAGVIDPAKMPEWAKDSLAERMDTKKNIRISEEGVFVYGGLHFKPYRKFGKRDGDWNKQMRSMRSDHDAGISKYEWQKADYSYTGFYEASSNSEADIFKCVENGKLYVPAENELFEYKEPIQKVKAEIKKPTLQQKLDSAKEKAREADAQNAGQGNKSKKRNGMEVT